MTLKLSRNDINSEDVALLEEMTGVNLAACYQCGNCSAGCPCADAMDIPPQRVMRLCQFGQIDEILKANSVWVCAACITCSARCPRGIDIAAVMEGLRNLILRKKDGADYIKAQDIDPELYKELPQIALINNFRKLTH